MIKTLGEDAVLATHDAIILETGGLPGVCPDKSLASALHRVEDYIYYGGVTDLHEIAALYAIAIAQGHVFNDGNRRTALITMYDFFEVNGLLLNAPPDIEDLMVDIAEKRISRTKLSDWLRQYTSKL